jgi:serine/threonine protein kinase
VFVRPFARLPPAETFCSHPDLSDRLKVAIVVSASWIITAHPRETPKTQERECWAVQVLQEAGIFHRDLTPANILINPSVGATLVGLGSFLPLDPALPGSGPSLTTALGWIVATV